MRRTRTLGVAALYALFSSTAVLGDVVVGSGAWRSWVAGDITALNRVTLTPFWNGPSWDGRNVNIGGCLSGNCSVSGPGALPCYGNADGTAITDFTMSSTGTVQAALEIELTRYAAGNAFGWYDTASPSTVNVIFGGSASPGAGGFFQPTSSYGFWFTSQEGKTFFSQSNNSPNDAGRQHFAIFQENAAPGREVYWIGIEDLVLAGSDHDHQDMIIRISATPVPDGGVTLILLGSVLAGLGALRRRFRA